MTTLEDSLLRKNVPGRYSSWTEEDDDRRCDGDDDGGGGDAPGNDNDVSSDSEDDEYYFEGLPSTAEQQPQGPPPSLRPTGNTGVKGVLADYREHQQQEQLRKEEERLEALRILQRATRPAVRSESQKNDNSNKNGNLRNDDADDLDDSDDEFFKRFRNQRLAELQQGTAASTAWPTFGSLTTVSPEEYVRLVDDLDPRVHLVVHLYEPTIQKCQILRSTLEKVAQCLQCAKFVEVRALEASPDLDTICLPAVLIYKGGELAHNLVRFTDDFPNHGGGIGVEDVREALERFGVAETR